MWKVGIRLFNICLVCCAVFFLSGREELCAQLTDLLYRSDSHIDTLRKGQLSLEIDNISFFKNNEFSSTVQKGYTLPGFWLQLKTSYYPLTNLKLEGGVHSIWFWGSTRYPAFAYKGISTWNGQDYARNVHVLPYFKAHIALSEHVDIVLGDIYGNSNHHLIEPLYNPELNLTSDPETGLQLLYRSKWLHFDTWVDWMTYIYNLDTKQESFVAGASACFMANSPKSPFHVYFQLQGLAHHKGGEIDITDEDVQTVANGAAGAGVTWNSNRKVLRFINAEFDLAGYNFPKGRAYTFDKGVGFYTRLTVQLSNFNVRTSYWSCRNFMPVFGSAFYGSISTKEKDMLYEDPALLYVGADYIHPLSKGFAFGMKAEAYCYLSGKMYNRNTGIYAPSAFGNNASYSIGVCLRINPSFLLKQY
ncbi:MAG: hypothetical protein LBL07_03565 [Tannerella sp.]|nr:hypothetical protein [Tannerella sp.]